MQFNGQHSGDVFTAAIVDRMTFADHANFRTLLDQVNKAKVQKCVFDLSRLAAVDSAGLGMFMIALNEGKKNGWSLTIKAPQGQVFKLMELAKFDKLLTIER
jgi:HptB-dependent secretion and biofilm anti anti-sigma factor